MKTKYYKVYFDNGKSMKIDEFIFQEFSRVLKIHSGINFFTWQDGSFNTKKITHIELDKPGNSE